MSDILLLGDALLAVLLGIHVSGCSTVSCLQHLPAVCCDTALRLPISASSLPEPDVCCPLPLQQEVWLLKRSLQRGQGHLPLGAHRVSGPFVGTTLPDAPAWTGDFAVDIAARVADPSGGTFWIKVCFIPCIFSPLFPPCFDVA